MNHFKMRKKSKSPKRRSKSNTKKPAAHPTYREMIVAAILALKQRGGSSRQAIAKYITGHYKVGETANVHLKLAFKRALTAGVLVTNATHSGTYRLSDAAKKPAPKPKKTKAVVKKPAAKKTTKKPAKKVVKKKTAAKKPAAKKTPKKAAPKKKVATKAKKPAAKKTPKKTAPKKVVKKTVKRKSPKKKTSKK